MMVTFLRIVWPMILRLAGGRDEPQPSFRSAPGSSTRRNRAGGNGRARGCGDGVPIACKFPRDGAGILSSLVETDGLIELPEDLTRLEPGATVRFLPFREVL